jgi:hypothetical protein
MSYDIVANIYPRVVEALATNAGTTDNITDIVDTKGLEGLAFLIVLGTISATAANTFSVLVEHGDASNLSDAEAVPDDLLNGTEALAGFTGADDGECRIIGYKCGHKRYVRLTVDMANNDGNVPIAIVALEKRTSLPVDNVGS